MRVHRGIVVYAWCGACHTAPYTGRRAFLAVSGRVPLSRWIRSLDLVFMSYSSMYSLEES